jgi:hypothetical protein
MPFMQTAVSSMNAAFNDRNIRKINPEGFKPGPRQSLAGALQEVPGLKLSRAVVEYLETWPSGLMAAIHGVLHDNLTRAATVPVTFAWQPGYDFSVTIHDVHDTKTSRGGITIVFTSRYPSDQHPLDVPS